MATALDRMGTNAIFSQHPTSTSHLYKERLYHIFILNILVLIAVWFNFCIVSVFRDEKIDEY